MNELLDNCENVPAVAKCAARREFLVQTTATTGGLLLSVAGLATVAGAQKPAKAPKETKAPPMAAETPVTEIFVRLDDKNPLNKVGGTATLDAKAGKVIIVRASETEFRAFSAVCPHQGGPISYDAQTKQFSCPWHGSSFAADGKNISGPARRPLTPYTTQNAVVVKLA